MLEESDIFVLPSDSEGMSNALLEGMAHANAVVVSNLKANRDLINNEINGYLFDSKQELREILNHLCSSKSVIQTLSKNAYTTIEKGFSFDHVSSKYLDLYSSLLR